MIAVATIATLSVGYVATYAAVEDRSSREDQKEIIEQVVATSSTEIQDIFAAMQEDKTSVSEEDRAIFQEYIKSNTDIDFSKNKRGGKEEKKGSKIDMTDAPSEIQAILEKKTTDRSSITEDDKATLRAYVQEQREASFAELPADIQTILEKGKEDKTSVTDEEKEILQAYFEENPDMKMGGGKGKKGQRKSDK